MKLIRDHVNEIARTKGGIMNVRYVRDGAEFDALLDAKLDEELAEWRESHDVSELADLLEVIREIAFRNKVTWKALCDQAIQKRRERGGFEDGVVWEDG